MVGTYEMVDNDGEMFAIDIPKFPLEMPVRLIDTQEMPMVAEPQAPVL